MCLELHVVKAVVRLITEASIFALPIAMLVKHEVKNSSIVISKVKERYEKVKFAYFESEDRVRSWITAG